MLAIKPFGILVKVGEQMKGLVPSMYLADIMMKNPEKKYNTGDEVKCRVSPWWSPCWDFGEVGFSAEVPTFFCEMSVMTSAEYSVLYVAMGREE